MNGTGAYVDSFDRILYICQSCYIYMFCSYHICQYTIFILLYTGSIVGIFAVVAPDLPRSFLVHVLLSFLQARSAVHLLNVHLPIFSSSFYIIYLFLQIHRTWYKVHIYLYKLNEHGRTWFYFSFSFCCLCYLLLLSFAIFCTSQVDARRTPTCWTGGGVLGWVHVRRRSVDNDARFCSFSFGTWYKIVFFLVHR